MLQQLLLLRFTQAVLPKSEMPHWYHIIRFFVQIAFCQLAGTPGGVEHCGSQMLCPSCDKPNGDIRMVHLIRKGQWETAAFRSMCGCQVERITKQLSTCTWHTTYHLVFYYVNACLHAGRQGSAGGADQFWLHRRCHHYSRNSTCFLTARL